MKKNYQFSLLCISYLILIISGDIRFISFGQNYINTMDIKGYYFLIYFMLLVICFSYKETKATKVIKIIGIILNLFVYFCSISIVVTNYNLQFTLDLGFYIYILSLLIFIIALFLSNVDKKEKINTSKESNFEKNDEIDNFIIEILY